MADLNNQNAWAAPPPPQTPGRASAGPSAAPPPPEVKVRTMKSDLESMARSGGGSPQFENVGVPPISAAGSSAGSGMGVWTALAVIIAIGLVAAIGYFSYKLFLTPKTAPPAAAPASPASP